MTKPASVLYFWLSLVMSDVMICNKLVAMGDGWSESSGDGTSLSSTVTSDMKIPVTIEQ